MAKILIIDDERAIRRALREILEFEDFHVDEAENGAEGLEKAKNTLYDIIFCDIKMPQMDGMEVLDALIAQKIDTPVIMISGHGNIETAVDAIKKGAFDFIEKPLDLNRILVTIRNAKDRVVLVEETKQLKTTVRKFKGSSIIGETEEINKIKQQPGKNLWFLGSPTLAQTFMRDDLIDEYWITVSPVVLGNGKRLFNNLDKPLNLKLLETKTFSGGGVALRYERVR